MGALASNNAPGKEAILDNIRSLAISSPEDMTDEKYTKGISGVETVLTAEQLGFLNSIRKREVLLPDDIINLDSTGFDIVDGLSANLITGQLGLVKPKMIPQIPVEN
jgi:hypothetical protein